MRVTTALAAILLQGVFATRHKAAPEPPKEDDGVRYLDHFKWHDPFYAEGDSAMDHYDVTCTATGTFHGTQYKFSDFDVDFPGGLAPWKKAMQQFFDRDYQGSWNGLDPRGPNRTYVMMEYHEAPHPLREWIEEQHRIPYNDKIWLMGVFGKPKMPEGADKDAKPIAEVITADMFDKVPANDKVLIFAPGAMYEIMPLFVAKMSEDPSCESYLRDLSKYDWYMKNDGVVAWPIEISEPDENKRFSVKIKAEHITESHHGREMRSMWERIYRAAHRQNRKSERAERQRARRNMEAGVVEDDDDDDDVHDEL